MGIVFTYPPLKRREVEYFLVCEQCFLGFLLSAHTHILMLMLVDIIGAEAGKRHAFAWVKELCFLIIIIIVVAVSVICRDMGPKPTHTCGLQLHFIYTLSESLYPTEKAQFELICTLIVEK